MTRHGLEGSLTGTPRVNLVMSRHIRPLLICTGYQGFTTIDYYTGLNIVLRYLRRTEGEPTTTGPTSFRLVHVVNLEVQLDGTRCGALVRNRVVARNTISAGLVISYIVSLRDLPCTSRHGRFLCSKSPTKPERQAQVAAAGRRCWACIRLRLFCHGRASCAC